MFVASRWGCNVAHFSCLAGSLEVAQWLAARGVDMAVANDQGHNALHKAAYGGHRELCAWLQDSYRDSVGVGLDREARLTDTRGQTPVDLATKAGHHELATYLIRHRASIANA